MTSPLWNTAWEAVNRHYAMQDVGELAEVLEKVAALDPLERIGEIGVGSGGTLWAWRQLGDDLEIYAVTEPVKNPAAAGTHGARVLWADSHSPLARRWFRGCLGANWLDVLMIDGDHSFDGARDDFESYGPLVRPGGLILFHDVTGSPGPRMLWAALTAAHPDACHTISTPDAPGFGVLTVKENER